MTPRNRQQSKPIFLSLGVDGLTALFASEANFGVLHFFSAVVACTRPMHPDIGFCTSSEIPDIMALIADRTPLPVIMDADAGLGNALTAQRTMRTDEPACASVQPLKDQSYPKRSGYLDDSSLIPVAEMTGKIRAMADARANDETLSGGRGGYPFCRSTTKPRPVAGGRRLFRRAGAEFGQYG